jgi:hypothetical protein
MLASAFSQEVGSRIQQAANDQAGGKRTRSRLKPCILCVPTLIFNNIPAFPQILQARSFVFNDIPALVRGNKSHRAKNVVGSPVRHGAKPKADCPVGGAATTRWKSGRAGLRALRYKRTSPTVELW